MHFHESNHPGPTEPNHPMHKTYASKRGICLLIVYGASVFAVLVWFILTNLPNLLVAQRQNTSAVSVPNPTEAKGELTPGPKVPNNLDVEKWEFRLLILVLCFGAAVWPVALIRVAGPIRRRANTGTKLVAFLLSPTARRRRSRGFSST